MDTVPFIPAAPIPADLPGPLAGFLGAARRRRDDPELLDAPAHDPAELAANLADIRTVNLLGGGTRTVMRHLPALVADIPARREIAILDLGCGSADIPLAVADWLTARSRPFRIVAADLSPDVLEVARKRIGRRPGIETARLDALATGLPDRAFDVVLCSLTLHHFDPPQAVALLREMDRLARAGCIVNDIVRSAPGYAAAWGASRVATTNRLTRNDMPLSVLRAYTPKELRGLLREAGIDGAKVTTHPLFRMAATWAGGERRAADGETGRAAGGGRQAEMAR